MCQVGREIKDSQNIQINKQNCGLLKCLADPSQNRQQEIVTEQQNCDLHNSGHNNGSA